MVFASPFIVESSQELVFWMETVLRFYFSIFLTNEAICMQSLFYYPSSSFFFET